MTAILKGSDVRGWVDQSCQNNTQYRGCTLSIRGYLVSIRYIVIWRLNDDTLCIAQHGHSVPSLTVAVDGITRAQFRDERNDWLCLWID